jgi:hypothetical protein
MASMSNKWNIYTVLVGILEEKAHSYNLRVHGRTILEMDFT